VAGPEPEPGDPEPNDRDDVAASAEPGVPLRAG
jgi:hypothetical protein